MTEWWSDADVLALRKTLHADGKTYAEATVALGRSYNSVRQKARKLGLCVRDGRHGNGGNISTFERTEWWRQENRVERLRSAIAAGHLCATIAAQLGTTKNAVVGKAYRLLGCRKPVKPALPRRYAFNEIGPGDCRWPFGHPDESDFHFCGEPAIHGRPYCGAHTAKAYIRL